MIWVNVSLEKTIEYRSHIYCYSISKNYFTGFFLVRRVISLDNIVCLDKKIKKSAVDLTKLQYYGSLFRGKIDLLKNATAVFIALNL